MPIERKDRSFDKIFEEVSLDKVPMNYVQQVQLHLVDGETIEFDLAEIDDDSPTFEELLDRVHNSTDIKDISIAIDYEAIKNDVRTSVKDVLDNYFDE